MTAHHNDWDTSAHRGESSSSTTFSFEIKALAQQMIEMRKDMLQMYRSNQQVNSVSPSCETCGGPHMLIMSVKPPVATLRTYMLHQGPIRRGERPQGALPSNTIPNPREETKEITTQSGNVLAGPSVSLPPLSSSSKEVERDPKTIMDHVHTESTTKVPPPVVQSSPSSRPSKIPPSLTSSSSELPTRNPHQPQIPYPSRLNKEKLQDKSDIQKLPEKLGDPRKFLIPCDFQELEKCIALADLGANINLIPLYVWKALMLPELVPIRMTLELANRSLAYPTGIAEDVFVQVGRPFLRTARALVDVHGEELILRDADLREIEYLLNRDPSTESSPKYDIKIIDPILERFTDKPALVYSPPQGDADDDHFDLKSDNDEWKKLLYGDSYNDTPSENDKSKDSNIKSLIDELESSESTMLLP
ncbi:reverse transcriptase domain-containing protein [Tanacetum coccineum]